VRFRAENENGFRRGGGGGGAGGVGGGGGGGWEWGGWWWALRLNVRRGSGLPYLLFAVRAETRISPATRDWFMRWDPPEGHDRQPLLSRLHTTMDFGRLVRHCSFTIKGIVDEFLHSDAVLGFESIEKASDTSFSIGTLVQRQKQQAAQWMTPLWSLAGVRR